MSVHKDTIGDRILITINYTLLTLLGISTVYPFIYFLILSFNDGFDALKGGIYLWPRAFTLDNYRKAFEHPLILNSFKITLSRTVIGTILSVLLTAMLAYGISKRRLPGRKALIFFFFFTTLFNGGLIPRFVLYRQIRLYNNFWVYVLPGIYSFYNAIVMKTFFDGIPDSLSEAAEIDGCSELGIFFKVILPLSVPVLATIALFNGVGHWNDWFTGSFFTSKEELMPAATLLNKLLTEATFESSTGAAGAGGDTLNINHALMQAKSAVTPESLRMTFLIIITTPIICVYPFLQKYFVKGVMVGSLKE
jgi:putative aldouronate transport system permease protein